jgi:hypothetical protein
MVGRVWPRHGHCGRPLNSVVRWHSNHRGTSMKHAGKEALGNLAPVLDALREQRALVERTPGSFYLKSSGFVHFHEDAAGLFADLKEDLVSFTRYRVSTRAERRAFLARVNRCLNGLSAGTTARGK